MGASGDRAADNMRADDGLDPLGGETGGINFSDDLKNRGVG